MAKHRRTRGAAHRGGRPGRLAITLRSSGVVAVVVLGVLGGARLVSFAAGPDSSGQPAAVGHPDRAPLTRPARRTSSQAPGKPSPARAQAPSASPTPTPTPSPSAPALANVSGSQITAVGDSVMVAATPALDQALPGISIDAMVGRQFSTGLDVLASLKAQGELRPIVVVGLGTNGTVTSGEIAQLFAEVGPGHRLVLVNTYEDRSWEQEVNSTLAAAASSHPDSVVLANWFTTIEHRTDLLWPDGIHPQPAGGVVYAKMLKTAVDQVGALPG
jgi:hypothetical protein